MPIYEFVCNACGAPVSVFVRSISSPIAAKCDRCDSVDLRRQVSRFAVMRADNTGLESLEDLYGSHEELGDDYGFDDDDF